MDVYNYDFNTEKISNISLFILKNTVIRMKFDIKIWFIVQLQDWTISQKKPILKIRIQITSLHYIQTQIHLH